MKSGAGVAHPPQQQARGRGWARQAPSWVLFLLGGAGGCFASEETQETVVPMLFLGDRLCFLGVTGCRICFFGEKQKNGRLWRRNAKQLTTPGLGCWRRSRERFVGNGDGVPPTTDVVGLSRQLEPTARAQLGTGWLRS
ncbi:hypothetical protein B0T14DRAFT_166611 [Immersiella caudata]|uniref:Secreted protein n=1 Tax=Immersiella caudata TaxID=314043 RepID=A0AA40C302_9PEZI|nr:hypothetical protein B0T14DRAFT_166611 [Immersiella caudata]